MHVQQYQIQTTALPTLYLYTFINSNCMMSITVRLIAVFMLSALIQVHFLGFSKKNDSSQNFFDHVHSHLLPH